MTADNTDQERTEWGVRANDEMCDCSKPHKVTQLKPAGPEGLRCLSIWSLESEGPGALVAPLNPSYGVVGVVLG